MKLTAVSDCTNCARMMKKFETSAKCLLKNGGLATAHHRKLTWKLKRVLRSSVPDRYHSRLRWLQNHAIPCSPLQGRKIQVQVLHLLRYFTHTSELKYSTSENAETQNPNKMKNTSVLWYSRCSSQAMILLTITWYHSTLHPLGFCPGAGCMQHCNIM
jgi:hypothetical protein